MNIRNGSQVDDGITIPVVPYVTKTELRRKLEAAQRHLRVMREMWEEATERKNRHSNLNKRIAEIRAARLDVMTQPYSPLVRDDGTILNRMQRILECDKEEAAVCDQLDRLHSELKAYEIDDELAEQNFHSALESAQQACREVVVNEVVPELATVFREAEGVYLRVRGTLIGLAANSYDVGWHDVKAACETAIGLRRPQLLNQIACKAHGDREHAKVLRIAEGIDRVKGFLDRLHKDPNAEV